VKKRRPNVIFAAGIAGLVLLLGCTQNPDKNSEVPTEEKRAPVSESSTPPTVAGPTASDQRPLIVAFGDSLTAGVVQKTYPEYLQQLLDENGYRYRVENQGVSGDTTTDGLARIQNVMDAHPALVLLEFGGNDGLRGIPVEASKQNLADMIEKLKEARIPLVLLGITLPPNYGPDYVQPFTAMFPQLARQYKIRLLPFLLISVYKHPDMMQPDGIHPNGSGNRVVAEDVFHFIAPLLKRSEPKKSS
jgi:acyl-CoA thioesterase-1